MGIYFEITYLNLVFRAINSRDNLGDGFASALWWWCERVVPVAKIELSATIALQ
jgi:hypothetical protein